MIVRMNGAKRFGRTGWSRVVAGAGLAMIAAAAPGLVGCASNDESTRWPWEASPAPTVATTSTPRGTPTGARAPAGTTSASAPGSVSGSSPGYRPSASTGAAQTSSAGIAASAFERTVVPGIAGEPDIRVRIESAAVSVTIGVRGGASGGGGGAPTMSVAPVGSSKPPARLVAPVKALLGPGGWELRDASGIIGRFDRGAELRIVADGVAPRATTPAPRGAVGGKAVVAVGESALTIEGRRYTGELLLSTRTDVSTSAFDVIESTGIERYLEGVVAAELPRGWPLRAFEAQAIAARSYAIHERLRSRIAGRTFDVENNVSDQAYDGATDNPVATRGVVNTRGVVLTWQGRLLRAYYSSTSGGRAASAGDTWPTSGGFEFNLAGPLQAQQREELGRSSPHFRWTISRTRQELTRRLREWGRINGHPVREISGLDSVRVLRTNSVGRPVEYAVVGAGRSFTIAGEALRRACNQSVDGASEVVRANRVNSSDMEWSFLGDVVTIRGRGLGHGVGLCQYSAKELAERGLDLKAIMAKFYPGARVERAY